MSPSLTICFRTHPEYIHIFSAYHTLGWQNCSLGIISFCEGAHQYPLTDDQHNAENRQWKLVKIVFGVYLEQRGVGEGLNYNGEMLTTGAANAFLA